MEGERARDGMPLVSVVVPALNAASYIRETLESVRAQSYRNWEMIVVDDGSTDETAAIVEDVAASDPRIRLLRQRQSGVAMARNRAILASEGAFIAPLDADDVWRSDNLAAKVSRFAEAPEETGLVYSWSRIVDRHGRPTGEEVTYNHEGSVFRDLIEENFVANGSAAVMRRECFGSCRYSLGYRQARAQGCEDWDLYLQVARRWKFAVVPDFTVLYRRAPNSLSTDRGAMARSHRLLLKRHGLAALGASPEELRRSFINFHLYLAHESFRSARYWETHRWFLTAVFGSRGYLMRERGTYKSLAKYIMAPLLWKQPVPEQPEAVQ